MTSDEKNEMSSVNVSKAPSPSDGKERPQNSVSLLETQTRTRRLFSQTQIFAFSLVYLGTWFSTALEMYFALVNGGPAAWFWSYIIVCFGVLCQAATFAEMASIQPIAGAQYYWTFNYAPQSAKLFLTWVQGWMTCVSYVALLASTLEGVTVMVDGMIALTNPEFKSGGWHTTLINLAWMALCAGINIYAFPLVPWLEIFSGFLNLILFVILFVVLWVMSPKNSTSIFFETNLSSGWENYFVAANIGALSNIFLFCSFESAIHLGEETRNAKLAVPRSVFWAVLGNMTLGFIMLVTFIICMPSLQILLDSDTPLVTILLYSTGSVKATTAMMSGLIVVSIISNVGVVSSVSRLSWAWARDGGLPKYFGYVDARWRVPVRAIALATILILLLSLLNTGSGTYVAFSAITSLTSLASYSSYFIALSCFLYARLTRKIEMGPWNWGRAGTAINAVAMVYTAYVSIFLVFPNYLPVTASNMNYCGPVMGFVLLLIVGSWFLRARNSWEGPNPALVELVLKEE